jgi:hypothetical protein
MREQISERLSNTNMSHLQLSTIKESLHALKQSAEKAKVYPLTTTATKITDMLSKIESVVQSNVSRSQGVEWSNKSGKENKVMNAFEGTVMDLLEKSSKGVSAYQVSKDYRDAMQIGSVEDIKRFA